jgi:hypothetical protein
MLVHRDQSDCDHAEQSDHARAEVDGETELVRRVRGARTKNPGATLAVPVTVTPGWF